MDNLNIQKPDRPEVEENIEPVKERPRWMPKITINKYFSNRGMIESVSEKPKTKSQINHTEKMIKARRIKNKKARKVRRQQRIQAGTKHCKLKG